jgi:AraC family transcriptional regulator of adaptative response / DNA-3-methyladenine glycosylase II
VDGFESRYLAVASRDRRFEGRFLVAVTSTGVYCRVGCPSRTPRPENVRFFTTAAAAEAAGFRPCRRCRPESSGAPGDGLVGRALGLIASGGVDGRGVEGTASGLGVSSRTLHRRLRAEVGAPPLRLAISRRAQTARTLISETTMPLTDIAFAAGFDSLRRFNEAMLAEFGAAPSALRSAPGGGDVRSSPSPEAVWLSLRLAARAPYAAEPTLAFLAARAVSAIEAGEAGGYRRSLRTRRGSAVVELRPAGEQVRLRVRLDDLRDLEDVVRRCRRLLDLDTDPAAVASVLGRDALLAPLVAAAPGLRVPGSVDPFETAIRAVLGQQVSVAAARTLAGRLVDRHGGTLTTPAGGVTRLFPTPDRLVDADLEGLGLTSARVGSIRALSRAVAGGALDLETGHPDEVDAVLRGLPGFGPWTRAYVLMRARGDPDALPASDLGLRRALARLGGEAEAGGIARRAEAWRPWRSYAVLHLWHSLGTAPPPDGAASAPRPRRALSAPRSRGGPPGPPRPRGADLGIPDRPRSALRMETKP